MTILNKFQGLYEILKLYNCFLSLPLWRWQQRSPLQPFSLENWEGVICSQWVDSLPHWKKEARPSLRPNILGAFSPGLLAGLCSHARAQEIWALLSSLSATQCHQATGSFSKYIIYHFSSSQMLWDPRPQYGHLSFRTLQSIWEDQTYKHGDTSAHVSRLCHQQQLSSI